MRASYMGNARCDVNLVYVKSGRHVGGVESGTSFSSHGVLANNRPWGIANTIHTSVGMHLLHFMEFLILNARHATDYWSSPARNGDYYRDGLKP